MTMPNFLVIGARKAGTTSLYHYLDQHPDVYMSPVKEPNFFALKGERPDFRGPEAQQRINRWSVADPEEYRELFRGVSGEKAIGEASPAYLCNPDAPRRIEHYVPEARLITVLRNPVERAYSAYMHQFRDGRERLDFARALEAEEERARNNWAPSWQYKKEGFYYPNLKRYLETFGRDRIRVYLYEDVRDDPAGVMRDIFRFLGVDDSFVPDTSVRHNVSGVPRSEALLALLRKPNPVKAVLRPFLPEKLRRRVFVGLRDRLLSKPPPLKPEIRRELTETYREDVLKLEGLIGRDLTAWLKEP